MADLAVFQICPSKGHAMVGDCGICAIATVSGLSYEDVVVKAVEIVGDSWKRGFYTKHIISLAKACGVLLKRRRKYDIDAADASGLLICNITVPADACRYRRQPHVVFLLDGRIYDWDLRVWAVDAFISHYSATFGVLLEIV